MFFRDKRQVTICVIGAVIIGVFLIFWFVPLRSKTKAIKQAKTERMFEIAKGTADAAQLPLLKEQLAKFETRLKDYEANIPDQRDHGLFLGGLAELMKEHDLKNQVITPGKEIEADKFNCIPINMRCSGKLTQICGFYRRLQDLDRLVRIEKVKLTNDGNYSGQVSMETDAVVYYRAKVGQG